MLSKPPLDQSGKAINAKYETVQVGKFRLAFPTMTGEQVVALSS